MVRVISTEELQQLIEGKEEYTLIDVREKQELVHGIIPTAKNIPLSEFEHAFAADEETFQKTYGFSKPSKEDKLIFYCRTGGRSQQATAFAEQQGYNATNYAGSVQAWSEVDESVEFY